MYIEAQYALQQFDLSKSLKAYKLYASTYPRDANALNNLAQTFAYVGDFEEAAEGFKKTWEVAKWDNVAANNTAGTLLAMDRIQEAEQYLKEARMQGGGDDVFYHTNAIMDGFLAGRAGWENELQWAAPRPEGFTIEATAGTINFFRGKTRLADEQWSHAAQRAIQQRLPDAAAGIYALRAVHDALVRNCAGARDAAHRGLALDHSAGTVPDAALAFALCGETVPALQEMQRLATASPTNTLVNDVYLPEVKAAIALVQHHPQQLPGILASVSSYTKISKAAQLLGSASLESSDWNQAATDFEPGVRYRGISLQEGAAGNGQAPDYPLCLLGMARAQSHLDKAAAIRSYQQLLDLWKSADADFTPALEAKRELAALEQ
jgi:tetratricopeptide (TPR) repeat protein